MGAKVIIIFHWIAVLDIIGYWIINGRPWRLPQRPGELVGCLLGGKSVESFQCSAIVGWRGRVWAQLRGVFASGDTHRRQSIKNIKMQPCHHRVHSNHQPYLSFFIVKIATDVSLEGGKQPTKESSVVSIHPKHPLNLQKSVNHTIGAVNHDILHSLVPKQG